MSSSLPSGWDEARVRNATPAELNALSDEAFSQIQAYIASQIRASLPSHATTHNVFTATFLTALQQTGLLGSSWGFVVFRSDYTASTDVLWDSYNERLPAKLHAAVTQPGGIYADDDGSDREDMAEARAGLGILWADDNREEVDGRGFAAVRNEYHALKRRGDIPDGMDIGVCLVADGAAVASLVDERADEIPAWLFAVDTEWDRPDGARDEDGYEGYIRVPVDSLLTELWPVLATGALSPKEIAATVGDGELWGGVG